MEGCLSYRKPIDSERWIYVGDGKLVEVEAIGHFRLLLCTGFCLDLKYTFVVSSFRRNLVSVSYLDKLGYLWSFGNNVFLGCLLIQILLELVHSWLMIIYIYLIL